MDEDEAELQALSQSLSSSATTSLIPPPPPPPLAPLPPPPPSLLRSLNPIITTNIPSSDSDRESSLPPPSNLTIRDYEVSEESRLARERQEKAVQELLLKRRAYAMAVPTNDSAVRARLRRLNEPITLFGEREMERRDRLRSLMVRLEADGQLDKLLKAHDEEMTERTAEGEDEEDEAGKIVYPFYTEGSNELVEARKEVARYSVERAMERIGRAKRRRNDPDEDEEGEAREACRAAGEFVLECSEIGDDRPLSGCSFSRDGMLLATR